MRYYDFAKQYDTDKKLPSLLDTVVNGGEKYSMTEPEWLDFCREIDACFSTVNRLQLTILYVKISIIAVFISYIFVVYVAFFQKIRLDIILVALFILVINMLLNCLVQGIISKNALEEAAVICQAKTTDLNLQAGEEGAVRIELHYNEWKPRLCYCARYEVDSKDYTRNGDIFIKISKSTNRALELPSIVSYYRSDDTEPVAVATNTAPNSDEFEGRATDVENQHIATAVQLSTIQLPQHRHNANIEPYVKVPMAKAAMCNSEEQSNEQVDRYVQVARDAQVVEEVEAVLTPYV
jgi:hypothetical protein